jgi:hypothetical protein
MPGAKFQRVARDHFQTLTSLVESPVAFTKYQIDKDEDRQSFVSTLLRQGEDEEIVKWSALAMYGGGADTVCFQNLQWALGHFSFASINRLLPFSRDSSSQ